MFAQAKRLPLWPAQFEPSGLKVFEDCRQSTEPERNIVAALIPHISQHWALPCYRKIAAALVRSPKPAVIYIFGFNHLFQTDRIFHATRCPYVVGGGEIEVCAKTMDQLEVVAGKHAFYYDRMHAEDWTIENALPPLIFAYGTSWKMVPIIVQHEHKMFTPGDVNYTATSAMLSAIATSVEEHIREGRRVMLVAAVDLSHHGKYFHDRRSSADSRAEIEAADREYLKRVFSLDAAGAEEFLGTNETRNDAIAAMSIVGRIALKKKLAHSGELLHFDRYHGTDVDRFVTVASGVLLGHA